jgi:hypothetical protein
MYAPTMYAGPSDNVYTTQSVVYRQREPGQVRLQFGTAKLSVRASVGAH